ncbi:MAG: C39 family peptidase [Deltaproteobacteria bacterium]|nr:C39 family peptidase [Deltaproteobacteria bacterium]
MYKRIYAPAFLAAPSATLVLPKSPTFNKPLRAKVALGAAFVFLTGCAHVTVETIKNTAARHPAAAAYIEGVPFYPQKESLCGPAAVASVTGYFNSAVSMEDAAKAVYDERWKGTLPIDLVIYAKEKGFDAEFYKGSLADIKDKLRAKTPLILFIDAGWGIFPSGHYIVATGYSDELESITAHSGMDKDALFSYAELQRLWQRTGWSAILLKPKGTMPLNAR